MNIKNNIKEAILVLSGKGGVGKSTIASQISFGLMKKEKKVGLLDIDLTGPSIPRIVGLQNASVKKSSQGWVPVYFDSEQKIGIMSIGFLIPDSNAPVVWRGPKKTSMIKQFIEEVLWDNLDVLIIDTPPGTSDEHLSIIETLSQNQITTKAMIVTTPQGMSISDVRREITFCQKLKVPILGIVENMSGFICPCCNEITNIFSSEGGKILAEETKTPFLGQVPIDPSFSNLEISKNEKKEENSNSNDLLKIEKKFLSETSLIAIEKIILSLLENLN